MDVRQPSPNAILTHQYGQEYQLIAPLEIENDDCFNRRLARFAIVGTSVGLQGIYLAPSFSVQHIVYGVAAPAALLGFLTGRNRIFSPLFATIVAWLFFAFFISTLTSPYSAVLLPNLPKIYMYLMAAIACGMAIGNSQQSVVKFTRFIIFTALASCVLAAIQATTGRFFFLAAKGMEDAAAVDEIAAQAGRAFGFFGNPNGLANWLAIPIAVTLARIVYPPSEGGNMKAKIWLPVLLGGMVLTASRSGYAITVLIIVLVFGHRVFKPKVTLITICSLLLCAVALRLMAPEFVEGVTQRVTRSTANDARWYLLRVGLNACMESPIFGLGLSSYPILSGFHAAHNGFLEPFVELGGFGYLPAMLGIGGGIFCGWRCAFIARKTNYEWLWRGWAAGITGLALSEMLHGIGWRTSLLWSMFAILYTSLLVLKQQRDTGQLVASR